MNWTQFKNEFKYVVYLKNEMATHTKYMSELHRWDNNGSHKKAILLAIDKQKELKDALTEKLKGRGYEDWLKHSKLISALRSKAKSCRYPQTKLLHETKLNNLIFCIIEKQLSHE